MVGKKKWTIYELCAVRAMLKAQFADGDIIDNFPLWFPDAKHEVMSSSIKHVQLDIISADAYINLEAQWEDIPGKKGYLLGLFALGMERDEIANHIKNKYPTHQWPDRMGRADVIDIATSTFHSCAEILGRESPISLYSEGKDAFVLVPAVLKEFNSGKTVDMIHEAGQRAVPLDHVVYILTRFRDNFWSTWSTTLQKQPNKLNLFQPAQWQPEYTNGLNSPFKQQEPIQGPQNSQVSPLTIKQTLSLNAESLSVESPPNQQTGRMHDSMIDPQLAQQDAAANYSLPDQWYAQCNPRASIPDSKRNQLMFFANNAVGVAVNNLKDQQWEGKEDQLRADDMENLFDFRGLE